jgi:hypothetical protein
MLTRLLLTGTACLVAAGCTSALPWNPPSRASTAIDGTYSGVAVATKSAAQPYCTGTSAWPFATPKLTVQNASVIWPASGTVTATIPVAADGTFYGQYGLSIISGRITGTHMDAFTDSLSCGTTMSLNKS